jgi:hypothetical protein
MRPHPEGQFGRGVRWAMLFGAALWLVILALVWLLALRAP